MKRHVQALATLPLLAAIQTALAQEGSGLEEVVVTATKRETSLQSTPLAITALDARQLQQQAVFSIDDFRRGVVPVVQIQTLPINPATLQLAIRGISNLDVSQMTRDSPVAVYVDGVYLGRTQGLALDLPDLERIEVLRGPQGTLFGRNAVGGALSIVTKKPTGEFGFAQGLTAGNYGMFRSTTTLNLPEVANVSSKLDAFYYTRDGLIENTMPGEHDFAELEKYGGRAALRWQPSDPWTVDYAFDYSLVKNTTDYGVYKTDPANQVGGPESGRITHSRSPTPFMEPGEVRQQGHALTIDWAATDLLNVKLIGSLRDMKQKDRTNFAESFSVGWFSPSQGNRLDQDQTTAELQFVGRNSSSTLEYAAGVFYFTEDTEEHYVGNGYLIPDFTNSFPDLHRGNTIFVLSQDLLGIPSYPSQFVNGYTVGLTGNPALFDPTLSDARNIISDAESTAVYAQATWSPEALDKRLHLTGGVRQNWDNKSGARPLFNGQPTTDSFDLSDENFDWSATVAWDFTPSINAYLRYATAYQGGGVNIRSSSFAPFGPEKGKSAELGIKAELLDNRLRINTAIFDAKYEDLQLDFLTPEVQTETINATEGAEVKGAEIEASAQITDAFRVNLNYNYMDGDLPLQPNPLLPGSPLTKFQLPMTPQNSGSLSGSYTIQDVASGNLNLYAEVVSRSDLYLTTGADKKTGGYTMLNARISLEDIELGSMPGRLRVSIWGNNLTDELYDAVQFSFPPTVIMGQNEPRMYGVDFRYDF
jgi:iron complex outermembrane receptor protein